MQAETRENSLENWKLERQSPVLVKRIGEESPAVKNIEQQTKDLIERNDKLSSRHRSWNQWGMSCLKLRLRLGLRFLQCKYIYM